MSIVVAGSGAFGTALAIALAGPDPIFLLGRNADEMNIVDAARSHPARLPGAKLPEGIVATADPTCLETASVLLLCIPTQQISGWLNQHRDQIGAASIVACCKGIEIKSLKGACDVISSHMPNSVCGVLTGPSFAADIARGLPTALTLAVANETYAKQLQKKLTRSALRLYRTSDVTGAQLGGALKNVIAIAAGACVGAGFGESARAALITRGFAEMQKLCAELGARPETLMGLSGLGDLILTCSSEQSRNFRLGQAIGAGTGFDEDVTVEGASTARAVVDIASKLDLDLPISTAVAGLVDKTLNVQEALDNLLSRPLREE